MAKLDDLIQQKQQRDEDWKAKKTAEREELGQLSDDAVMHVTSEPGAYLHYLDTQAADRFAVLSGDERLLLPEVPVAVALAVFDVQELVCGDRHEIGFDAVL